MATINIWDVDGEVRCKATLKGKKYQNARVVKFEFLAQPGDVSAGTVDAQLSGSGSARTATATWRPQAVPADKLSQKFHYRVVVDGTAENHLPDEVVVWARDIEVTAKLASQQPAPNALVKFTLDDAPPKKGDGRGAAREQVLRADDQGKITFRLPYPSGVATALQRPWTLDGGGWVVAEGRKREVIVRRGFLAAIEWPPADPTPHRQWVNLPEHRTKPEQGKVVRVKIKAAVPDEAQAGDPVFIKVTYDGANSERTPKDGEQAAGAVVTHERQLSAQKTCSVDVVLSPAGGDKVTVAVGGTHAAEDATVEVQSWRKLFYALAYPDFMDADLADDTLPDDTHARGLPVAVRTALKEILDPVFLEYRLAWSQPSAGYPPRQRKTATFMCENGRDRLVQTQKDYDTDEPVAFPGLDARTVKVKLCDAALASDTTTVVVDLTVMGATFDYPFKLVHDNLVFDHDLNDGNDVISVDKCTWTAVTTGLVYDAKNPHPAFDARGKPKSGPMDRAWITVKNIKTIHIAFPQNTEPYRLAGGDKPKTGIKIKVRFKVTVPAYGINGCARLTRQLMVLKPQAPKCMAATLCHELGHSIGMAIFHGVPPEPPGLPKALTVDNGGTYYRQPYSSSDKPGKKGIRTGHVGAHCAAGVKTLTGTTFVNGEGTCIMFGEGGSDDAKARTAYCATCTKHVKARNVSDLSQHYALRKPKDC